MPLIWRANAAQLSTTGIMEYHKFFKMQVDYIYVL